jgi:hypothetical protein
MPAGRTRAERGTERALFASYPDTWRAGDRTRDETIATCDHLLEILEITRATTIGEALETIRRMTAHTRHGAN